MNSLYNLFLILLIIWLFFFKNNVCFTYYFYFFIPLLDVIVFQKFFNIFDCNNYLKLFTINTSLTNGLLLIHPIVLYLIFSFLLFFSYTAFIHRKMCSFIILTQIYFFSKKYILISLLVTVTAIFLGSWWAQLELNWGGWWGWDFIELISLNYIIICILLIHTKYFHFGVYYYFFDILLRILLFIFLVKFNFIDSVHNFSVAGNYLQNYYEVIFVLFFIFIFYKRLKLFYGLYFIYSNNIHIIMIFFLSFLWVFNIYLINEFFLIFLNKNIFFYNNSSLFLIYFVVLIIYVGFTFFKKLYTIIFLPFWEFFFISSSLFWKNFLRSWFIHVLVFLFLYLSVLNFNCYNMISTVYINTNFLINLVITDYFLYYHDRLLLNTNSIFNKFSFINLNSFIFNRLDIFNNFVLFESNNSSFFLSTSINLLFLYIIYFIFTTTLIFSITSCFFLFYF